MLSRATTKLRQNFLESSRAFRLTVAQNQSKFAVHLFHFKLHNGVVDKVPLFPHLLSWICNFGLVQVLFEKKTVIDIENVSCWNYSMINFTLRILTKPKKVSGPSSPSALSGV